jgi:hypothetical protein
MPQPDRAKLKEPASTAEQTDFTVFCILMDTGFLFTRWAFFLTVIGGAVQLSA